MGLCSRHDSSQITVRNYPTSSQAHCCQRVAEEGRSLARVSDGRLTQTRAAVVVTSQLFVLPSTPA